MMERLFSAVPANSLAAPKSRSFIPPYFVIMILSGLMSLWIIPVSCTLDRDRITGSIISSVLSTGIFPPFCFRYCFNVTPSMYSITIYAVLFSLKKSRTSTIPFRFENFARFFASLMKPSRHLLTSASFFPAYIDTFVE